MADQAPRPPTRRSRLTTLTLMVAVTAALAGCSVPNSEPTPTPSQTATAERPFTVLSTDRIRVADPAAVADSASAVLSLNAFQRLMTADPGESVLKPDAARDCLFTTATTYTCTLNEKLFFANGDALTSRDVKFSIERAVRLRVPGSSAALLSSLQRVETPDPRTISFQLSRVDTQFGWALASPAASIVDSRVYSGAALRPIGQPVVGSGPFTVTAFDGTTLRLARYLHYVGRNPDRNLATVTYRTVRDSAALEEAMHRGQADLVWRGLDAAAVTRLSQQAQADELTEDGYRPTALTGVRVHELEWSATARSRSNRAARLAVADALQGIRTLDSVVPGGVAGHLPTFRTGGRGAPVVSWSGRIPLVLGYDPTAPDARDLATRLSTRLTDSRGFTVRLSPGTAGADLVLVDRKAWTATALAWLEPYLATPLPGRRTALARVQSDYRSTYDDATATRLLGTLQTMAAADATVLPVSQGDEYVFARDGVTVTDNSYGPGWQLGLFGMKA